MPHGAVYAGLWAPFKCLMRRSDRGCAQPCAVVLLVLILAAFEIEPALTQTSVLSSDNKGNAEQQIELDIPAQSLETALGAFGAATQIQLFANAELTSGRQSRSLKGKFIPRAALDTLLAGTGLAARAIDDQGFTLVALPTAAVVAQDRAVSPSVLRFNRYSAALQDAVRNALCQHDDTAPGSYRVLARFWIASTGAVARAELVTSTGETQRDGALTAAFQHLAIGTVPPVGMPQPVTLLVTSDTQSARYCSNVQRSRTAFDREAVR
jgi:hypothetical protein